MMMYLTAIKMQQHLGFGKICNVGIPLFDINIPDLDVTGQIGLHDRRETNARNGGLLPFLGYKKAIENSNAKFLSLEGFYQNINNFPPASSFDYQGHFPFLEGSCECGGDDDIVINIRGGEILRAIHPHYTLLPIDFYEYIVNKTGKRPIFYGQLDASPYLDELKLRFPDALFVPSRGVAKDFDFIRRSQYIVPALSTFSWMAAWLSKAKRIFFPVAGVFSPMQHPSSMLLPLNDLRYEFYLFPVYFARKVEEYRDYLDPIQGKWEYTTNSMLRKMVEKDNITLDESLSVFDSMEYLESIPHLADLYDKFGKSGLINHFCEVGFWEGNKPIKFDEKFYSENYPDAALRVARGEFSDLISHYIKVGSKSGNVLK
ncbi:hypothetical protein [Acetobacter senegalensis]|uniref:hypothetical protein n=1 Tax=Acetobacter senegalensis TaxID=446692 RepID=UPI001EDB71BF|nr:hypothetical protein [Acetobacter senegalensis]